MESVSVQGGVGVESGSIAVLSVGVLEELWREADGGGVGLSVAEFDGILMRVGVRCGFGVGAGNEVTPSQVERFCRGLQLVDLALAQACALGREVAWERFVARFKGPLRQAAVGITRSSGLGEELADSLYSELYGLRERDGVRVSPLSSYTGRGSLMGWLRTTLAQRFVDWHRKTGREEALEDHAEPVAVGREIGEPGYAGVLGVAVGVVLGGLGAEERFLLAAYFLDGRTLAEIGQLLRVHEATVSRRLKRLTEEVSKKLVKQLQAGGLIRGRRKRRWGVIRGIFPFQMFLGILGMCCKVRGVLRSQTRRG